MALNFKTPSTGIRAKAPSTACALPAVRLSCSAAHHNGAHTVCPSPRYSSIGCPSLRQGPLMPRQSVVVQAQGDSEPPVQYNKEFGYSRKDIILIGAGLMGLGYAMYYGLQAIGMDAGMAGNWVQLIIFLGICVGWISTYLFRVATKQMTYVKQLEAYEEAVMRKRLEEMTEDELAELAKEAEAERLRGKQ